MNRAFTIPAFRAWLSERGGPNHISNLVLATQEWNRRAVHLSVSEKVRLREQARAAGALAQ